MRMWLQHKIDDQFVCDANFQSCQIRLMQSGDREAHSVESSTDHIGTAVVAKLVGDHIIGVTL